MCVRPAQIVRPGFIPRAPAETSAMRPRNDRTNLTSRHRLRDFDYTQPGFYFVTFTTHRFQMLFGQVIDGDMDFTPAGAMLAELLGLIEQKFPAISPETFVVMPNHVHLLLYQSLVNDEFTPSDVVRWIKGKSLAAYREGVEGLGWEPFEGKLWKEGFHDEVLRTEIQMENVRRYIIENPRRWDEDELRSMKDEGGSRRN